MCCSSTQEDSLPSACLRGLARHFKTDPTETVALCFGYPKTRCLRAEGKLSSSVDEQHIRKVCFNETHYCFKMCAVTGESKKIVFTSGATSGVPTSENNF
jgi:hypothetical protein